MWQNLTQNARSAWNTVGDLISFAPFWALSLAVLLGVTLVGWLIHSGSLAVARRVLGSRRPYLQSILDQTRAPARVAIFLIAVAVALPIAPLSGESRSLAGQLLLFATVCLLGWLALTATQIVADIYLLRFRVDVSDNLLARKHVTQVRVLVRIFDVLIILITAGFALMTFQTVREYGYSLFASAGVAGIIAGLAARPVLTNFLAGVQIAVAQPIRIDDAIIVENEWGNVEEITFSYVVVRLWDLRRMVVPLSYFIEKPFQNWTRVGTELIGAVLLYVDHTTPVEAVRSKLTELVAQSKLWNGKVVNLQVTDCNETTIQLRALVSANDSSAVWDLRCEVREKLIEFLRREYPHALPRRRNDIVKISAPENDELRAPKRASPATES